MSLFASPWPYEYDTSLTTYCRSCWCPSPPCEICGSHQHVTVLCPLCSICHATWHVADECPTCSKCSKRGHKRHACPILKPCPGCQIPGHKREACPRRAPCIKCLSPDHSALDNVPGCSSKAKNRKKNPSPKTPELDAVKPHRAYGPPTANRHKTALCHNYAANGVCKFGEKCRFAHGAEELRQVKRQGRRY